MKRRAIRLTAALFALTLVAAACSESDDDDDATEQTGGGETTASGGDTTAPDGEGGGLAAVQTAVDDVLDRPEPIEGETTRGVTETAINVKGVTALRTPAGVEPFPGMCEGAQARFERANREGGVNGRTINYIGCVDDGSDRDRNRQLMQEAVEEDEAFAIIPVTSQGFFSEDYLNQERVPYFGFGFQPGYCGYEYPFAFAVTGAASCDKVPDHFLTSQLLTGVYVDGTGKDASELRVAIIGEDNPAGETGIEVVARGVEGAGAEVVYKDNPLPPASGTPVTDYSPFATAILAEDPTLVMIVTSDAPIAGLSGSLAANGYTGDRINFVYSDGRIFLQEALAGPLDGIYTVNAGIGAAQFGGETFEQIAEDLQAAGVEQYGQFPLATEPDTLTNGVIYGYGSADFFLAALAETPEPLTAEAFANTINDGFEYPGLGNAVCPSLWPLMHLIGSPCGSMVRADRSLPNPIASDQPVGFFEPITDMKEYPLELVQQ
jgi:ABC-type branched-subunit amino acid transport system substrate-binding protein